MQNLQKDMAMKATAVTLETATPTNIGNGLPIGSLILVIVTPHGLPGKMGALEKGALTEAWEETGQTRLQAQKEARGGKEAMVERRENGALRPCRRFP